MNTFEQCKDCVHANVCKFRESVNNLLYPEITVEGQLVPFKQFLNDISSRDLPLKVNITCTKMMRHT